jgi:hypothetical protein
MTTDLNVPVALIVFNRPSHTETVFKTIASARPKRLFILADGPRAGHPTDAKRCAQVRAVVQNVTWPCDVRTDFADDNMGPDRRTISGTNWVFSQVDEAIFLEDDTVPDHTFFRFCEEMLIRYRDDRRVMSVCGFNLLPGQATRTSYFFSMLANPWGRAIWRRSWEGFDQDMRVWPEVRDQHLLSNIFPHRAHRRYWEAVLEHAYRRGSVTWDYRFMLTSWLQNGLSVVPARNLIRNIGFGPDATHTKVDVGGVGKLPSQGLDFPLRHPTSVMPDRGFDDRFCDRLLRDSSLLMRCKNKAKYISSRLVEFVPTEMHGFAKRPQRG